MIYTLENTIEVHTKDDVFYNIEAIKFLPIKGKHILLSSQSLEGLIEDYNDIININKIINETLNELKISSSGIAVLEEKNRFKELTLHIIEKYNSTDNGKKAIMYNKIDKLIANFYFQELDGGTLAEGITTKGTSIFLTNQDYKELYERDIIGIRNLFLEKKK